MIEIEQRYKVHSVDKAIAMLAYSGITQTGSSHIIDEWYAPLTVQSHQQQEQWFDEGRGVAYRIRQVEQPDGSFMAKLESKQLTAVGNHNTFDEQVINVAGYEEALAFVANKYYWNWLTIDKTRLVFDSHDPELDIVLDEITGLAEKIGVGAALEIEYQGEADRDGALAKLNTVAEKLGLTPEQLFAKSLTVEAMTELAKFKKPANVKH